MYGKLRDYSDSGTGEFTASAIVACGHDATVGIPCLLDFTNVRVKKPYQDADIGKMFKEKNTALALNELLHKLNPEIIVKYLFPPHGLPHGHTSTSNGNSFHCLNRKPILRDTYRSSVVKSLGGITPAKKLPELPVKISKSLKKYRYINYVLHGLCMSNVSTTINRLYAMIESFMHKYPNHTCVYMRGNGRGTLIDTLSISFYKLTDVIPIFDPKRTSGVAMELLLTNSLLSGKDILNDDSNYVLIRILLSKHRDNIFTIDGERIVRHFERPISDVLNDQVYPLLKRSTPDDTALKKAKPNKEGE